MVTMTVQYVPVADVAFGRTGHEERPYLVPIDDLTTLHVDENHPSEVVGLDIEGFTRTFRQHDNRQLGFLLGGEAVDSLLSYATEVMHWLATVESEADDTVTEQASPRVEPMQFELPHPSIAVRRARLNMVRDFARESKSRGNVSVFPDVSEVLTGLGRRLSEGVQAVLDMGPTPAVAASGVVAGLAEARTQFSSDIGSASAYCRRGVLWISGGVGLREPYRVPVRITLGLTVTAAPPTVSLDPLNEASFDPEALELEVSGFTDDEGGFDFPVAHLSPEPPPDEPIAEYIELTLGRQA